MKPHPGTLLITHPNDPAVGIIVSLNESEIWIIWNDLGLFREDLDTLYTNLNIGYWWIQQ
jgi:hypothetical protein